ncbi:unnamed protein product [Urochloa humidicola]
MAPHLPEDVLLQIFAALDVPDLARAGSVCSSWHGAWPTPASASATTAVGSSSRRRASSTPPNLAARAQHASTASPRRSHTHYLSRIHRSVAGI